MTTTETPATSPHAPAAAHPHAAPAPAPGPHGAPEVRAETPRGVQSVKFSFYRVRDEVRGRPNAERHALADGLERLLDDSADAMLTRAYSTVGTRADTDFLVWQVHDDLDVIQSWHSAFLQSPLAVALERTHSYLSMTMRSMYSNPEHEGAERRERLRVDGGTDAYLFVYPMAKTREWYQLPLAKRQRMMSEHIAVGHRYHGIKINTTYSYGLDDQEFVVAFEGNEPGEFLALVRELRESDSTSYTEFDTPMFTCRRLAPSELTTHIGLRPGAGS